MAKNPHFIKLRDTLALQMAIQSASDKEKVMSRLRSLQPGRSSNAQQNVRPSKQRQPNHPYNVDKEDDN